MSFIKIIAKIFQKFSRRLLNIDTTKYRELNGYYFW